MVHLITTRKGADATYLVVASVALVTLPVTRVALLNPRTSLDPVSDPGLVVYLRIGTLCIQG